MPVEIIHLDAHVMAGRDAAYSKIREIKAKYNKNTAPKMNQAGLIRYQHSFDLNDYKLKKYTHATINKLVFKYLVLIFKNILAMAANTKLTKISKHIVEIVVANIKKEPVRLIETYKKMCPQDNYYKEDHSTSEIKTHYSQMKNCNFISYNYTHSMVKYVLSFMKGPFKAINVSQHMSRDCYRTFQSVIQMLIRTLLVKSSWHLLYLDMDEGSRITNEVLEITFEIMLMPKKFSFIALTTERANVQQMWKPFFEKAGNTDLYKTMVKKIFYKAKISTVGYGKQMYIILNKLVRYLALEVLFSCLLILNTESSHKITQDIVIRVLTTFEFLPKDIKIDKKLVKHSKILMNVIRCGMPDKRRAEDFIKIYQKKKCFVIKETKLTNILKEVLKSNFFPVQFTNINKNQVTFTKKSAYMIAYYIEELIVQYLKIAKSFTKILNRKKITPATLEIAISACGRYLTHNEYKKSRANNHEVILL